MYSDYVSAGFDPVGFWSLTPRLYLAQMKGANARIEREAREAAWHAWHVAAFTRARKLPKLDKILKPAAKTRRTKVNWQDQAGMWAAYAARRARKPSRS
ncbi:hypothetical protein [Paracoccus alkanivorans]|uniref:Uncharacterized protein n=1 Tax=Paracoccus alkanivorans TaxID=2116655 RepID=A0A3M0MMF2_9RHOB|nr:hypothetical protein [Paracoccus alkanivorans]RMC37494.1 hypothetical protein C9E81_01715 [Paracoccus alkanivorans]